MKPRGFILFITLLLVTGTAFSLPSIMGFRGVSRVVDARTIGENEMAFSLIMRYWSSTDKLDDLHYRPRNTSSDTTLSVEDTEHLAEGFFALDYGLMSFLELAARISYVGSFYEFDLTPPRNQTIGQWDDIAGMGDVMLGFKAGFTPTPSTELLWLGLDNWFSFAPRNNETVICEEYDGRFDAGTPMFVMRRPSLSTGHTTVGIDGLISLDMANVWPGTPLRVHVNAGYSMYKQTISMEDYILEFDTTTGQRSRTNLTDVSLLVKDNALDLGFALEFPTNFAVIFTEFSMKKYLDRDSYSTVSYFTPGIRVFSGGGVIMDFSFNMGLSDFDPAYFDFGHGLYQNGSVTTEEREQKAPLPDGGTQDWGVSMSIAFSSDLVDRGPIVTTGTVSGMITEIVTGEPVEATVSFPGTPVQSVTSDIATGFFSATLPEGSIPVTVAASGYNAASATVVLGAGQDVVVDFALEPSAGQGQIAGTVTEFENHDPLQATITVETEETITVNTTVDGVFQIDAPEGTWTVKAEADGYVSRSQPVVVTADQTSIVDFVLRPALETGQVLSFDNIYFDSGSSTIKPESYYILNNMVEILNANPTARVQIAGHTDSDGSTSYNQTLSEQRASSVFTYLVQNGVPANRLTTMGFGENQPVVPNTSAANKAMNRRIEFTVLSI